MKRPIYFCTVLLFSYISLAQVHEELTVTYKDIRVHVIDRDGNPVKGLTGDQFILKERRQERERAYFEEVDLTQQVSESRITQEGNAEPTLIEDPVTVDRFIVLFLDSSHMTLANFKKSKNALLDFIESRMRESDFVKVVQTDRSFQHLTGFTKDKSHLRAKIEEATYQGGLRRDLLTAQRRINDLIEDWDTMAPDMRPAVETGINELIKEKARIKANYFRTYHLNMMSIANMLEHIKGAKSIFLFTGGGYLEFDSAVGHTQDDSDRLGRVLNNANATIYTLLFGSPNTLGGDGSNLNLSNQPPGFGRSLKYASTFPPQEQQVIIRSNTVVEDRAQLESAPMAASENTGGLYLKTYDDDKASDRLKKLDQVAAHYYRLGFVLENPQKRLNVKVQLKENQNGWTLRYGSIFEPDTPYLKLKKNDRDIAFKAMLIYGQIWRNDLDAEWDCHIFSRKGGGFRVSVMGAIPVEKQPSKGYELGFVALDKNQQLLDMTTMTLTNAPLNDGILDFYDVLLPETRPHSVRASIRNMDTGTLAFHQFALDQKAATSKEPSLSSILVATSKRQSLGLNHLRIAKDAEMAYDERQKARRNEDPFMMGENLFCPDVAPYRLGGGIMWFMFHIENPLDVKKQIQFLVKSKDGAFQAPGRIGSEFQEAGHSSHIQGILNTSNLPEGKYMLWVRVVYPDRPPIMGKAPFEIIETPQASHKSVKR